MIATAAGNSAAALVDPQAPAPDTQAPRVAPVVSQLDEFPICGGGFSGNADANHVTLNDDRVFVLAASPECLAVLASPRAIPGPAKISIESPVAQWNAGTTLVSLHFDPPLPPLVPDKKSKLVLHVQGSDQALRVLVENKTPGVLRFVARRSSGIAYLRRNPEFLRDRRGGVQCRRFLVSRAHPCGAGCRRRPPLSHGSGIARTRRISSALSRTLRTTSRTTRATLRKSDAQIDEIMSTTMAGDFRTLAGVGSLSSGIARRWKCFAQLFGRQRLKINARGRNRNRYSSPAEVSILGEASGNAPCAICSSELRARPRRLSASS